MKKFIAHYSKKEIWAVEVECEKVFAPELKGEEWKARITKPSFLFEKNDEGKLVEPIFYWFAFHDSIDECLAAVTRGIKVDWERRNFNFTSSDVAIIVSTTKIVML